MKPGVRLAEREDLIFEDSYPFWADAVAEACRAARRTGARKIVFWCEAPYNDWAVCSSWSGGDRG